MLGRQHSSQVEPSTPRQTVQVRFPQGELYEAPNGTPLEEFVRAAESECTTSVVAALVDGELRELTWRVTRDAEVMPLSMATGDGMRIYRRSLCFLLIVAAQELFPQARIMIDHSLTLGGLFCQIAQREPFNQEELARLTERMREIVAADEPITRREIPLAQAIEGFRERGYEDKVRLLSHRRKEGYLPIYTLRGIHDYFYGDMVPSAGYLCHFALRSYPPGFILCFPPRYKPAGLSSFHDFPRLATVFREYGEWAEAMEVGDVGALNQAVEARRIPEVILVSEALHERCVADIAKEITSQRDRVRLVLIAGPSSSGKTTFAKRLAIQLLANCIRPIAISLDDYFLSRDDTPRDAQGEPDFESLEALDLELFNHQLRELMAGRKVALPRYDFLTGQRQRGATLAIGPQHIILAEGIHGLNPDLVPQISQERVYRIYVSALTQLNLDCHNRIPTTDTRLLRRLVRDAPERGISAQETIRRWERVVQGEFRNIFPYQENADVMFNSALVYEMAVMKPFAEPLLHQIDPGSMEYVEARRLLAFLEWFLPVKQMAGGAGHVPDNSILREFIGGSTLKDFRL
jgi:uridine kinase